LKLSRSDGESYSAIVTVQGVTDFDWVAGSIKVTTNYITNTEAITKKSRKIKSFNIGLFEIKENFTYFRSR
jgi:hypothetical protein